MSIECPECGEIHEWNNQRPECHNALDRLVTSAREALDAGATVDEVALAVHVAEQDVSEQQP